MIIGITGTQASGKGTVVKLLAKQGFVHFSVAEYLRQVILEQGMTISRDTMKIVADKLRKQNGGDYIIKRLHEFAQLETNAVIESVRTVAELEFIKSHKGIILAVNAPQEDRYARSQSRNGDKDHVSFEKFVEQEQSEMQNQGEHEMNLVECMKQADFTIENVGSEEELTSKVTAFLANARTSSTLEKS